MNTLDRTALRTEHTISAIRIMVRDGDVHPLFSTDHLPATSATTHPGRVDTRRAGVFDREHSGPSDSNEAHLSRLRAAGGRLRPRTAGGEN